MVAKIAFFMFPPEALCCMGKHHRFYNALCGIRELSKIAQSQIPAIWLRLRPDDRPRQPTRRWHSASLIEAVRLRGG